MDERMGTPALMRTLTDFLPCLMGDWIDLQVTFITAIIAEITRVEMQRGHFA